MADQFIQQERRNWADQFQDFEGAETEENWVRQWEKEQEDLKSECIFVVVNLTQAGLLPTSTQTGKTICGMNMKSCFMAIGFKRVGEQVKFRPSSYNFR